VNLLINPSSMVQGGYTPPPLGLLYIAAMDKDTEIYDDALYRSSYVPEELSPRVVGVGMCTSGRYNSLGYLREAKKRGAVTVTGGPHIAVMLDQMVEHYSDFIDYFVVGDGELAWKAICDGKKLSHVIRMRVEDLDTLPLPAWAQVDFRKYPARGRGVHRGNNLSRLPRVPSILGRGCSGHCTFCSVWWVNGKSRHHGKEWIAANLAQLWKMGARHLEFQDDCLTNDREATFVLCDMLEKYNFSWGGTTRSDKLDLELALRMAEVGCHRLAFGIESGSQKILDRMHKQLDLAKSFEAREACRKAGIHFTALMMKNFPGTTPETNKETEEFLVKLQPDSTGSVGATWVFPGTALYQECKRAGLIDDSFWLGGKPYYIYRRGLDGPSG